jgi:hypothetical protein
MWSKQNSQFPNRHQTSTEPFNIMFSGTRTLIFGCIYLQNCQKELPEETTKDGRKNEID